MRVFVRLVLLSSIVYLLSSTCVGVTADRKPPSHQNTLRRSRRSPQSPKQHKGAHHRPLTDEQKADQNLQFMLSLYRSAAEPDGRPKQHRKFGSNTVRLLRPSASSVHYQPTSTSEILKFPSRYLRTLQQAHVESLMFNGPLSTQMNGSSLKIR